MFMGESMFLQFSHFVVCYSFLLCGQSILQTSKGEKVKPMLLNPVYFPLITLGGLGGFNNLVKLKGSKF